MKENRLKSPSIYTYLVCCLAALVFSEAFAQEALTEKTNSELIEMVESIYVSFDKEQEGKGVGERLASHNEAMISVDRVEKELIGRGVEILPSVENMVWGAESYRFSRSRIISSLREIKGDAVDYFLVRVLLGDSVSSGAGTDKPDVVSAARDTLIWRGTKGGGVSISLSTKQLETLLAAVRDGSDSEAITAATLLAVFSQNVPKHRVEPVVQRLIRVSENPPTNVPRMKPSYSHDNVLGMYVSAFINFGKQAQPILREALAMRGVGVQAKKWLTLALGFAGDVSVGDTVRAIANDEAETVEVRCIAVGSYAAAVGSDAIPQLEEWKKDTTLVKTEIHNIEVYPIALAANEKWLQLRRSGKVW